MEKQIFETTCIVDGGTIKPTFILKNGAEEQCTSGFLKYFFPLNGKKVKVTVEVLKEENGTT